MELKSLSKVASAWNCGVWMRGEKRALLLLLLWLLSLLSGGEVRCFFVGCSSVTSESDGAEAAAAAREEDASGRTNSCEDIH